MYVARSSVLGALFLALLIIADGILTNALPFALGSTSPQTPGLWNLTTTALILSTISDLFGQMILVPVIYRWGLNRAMNLNSLSVLAASVFSIISLIFVKGGRDWIPIIASVFKLIGGGFHASVYLAIVLNRQSNNGSSCSILIYINGAVLVLCQTLASAVTPVLAKIATTLPYIFSAGCCILAIIVTAVRHADRDTAKQNSDPSARPLLPRVARRVRDTASDAPMGLIGMFCRMWHDSPSMTKKAVISVGSVFLTTAITKATRPLFLVYIQQRLDVTPEWANTIWNVRTVMSVIILAVVLPLAMVLLPRYTSRKPSTISLYTAKTGVVLLAVGALLIGVARPRPVLIAGLVVNALGVVTDAALLGFTADAITRDMAGIVFMTIASLESAGTLVGIGLLYPLYQSSLHNEIISGGLLYYICAGIFTIAGAVIWRLTPLVDR